MPTRSPFGGTHLGNVSQPQYRGLREHVLTLSHPMTRCCFQCGMMNHPASKSSTDTLLWRTFTKRTIAVHTVLKISSTAFNLGSSTPRSCVACAIFAPDETNIERAFAPGSMPVLLRPDRGCSTFSLRMRAVWRHDVFMTRAIRQKNGMDTLYTLHTSRGSGDAVLTNEKLCRASRREVAKSRYLDKIRLGVKGVAPSFVTSHQHTSATRVCNSVV